MVFGNMGESSAKGVAFTRNPATGEDKFFGEWLVNAQGEDVVAGLRTPNPLNEETKTEGTKDLPSLESSMPDIYSELKRFVVALKSITMICRILNLPSRRKVVDASNKGWKTKWVSCHKNGC